MFGSGSRINYQHNVEGTWGQFITPAGEVQFLLTKARLGHGGIDNERRLTSQLRPVREVLDSEKLNFNQLLQRDLDDHRVATQLISYLLEPEVTGPAFFPPIMTVLLPFSAERPIDFFPQIDFSGTVEDEQLKGLHWIEKRAENAYRIRQMAYPQGDLHEIKLGQLSWNDEAAKLVVLDGQHRAMALIAIDRTINSTWDQNSGTRFRHFYEHRIQNILDNAKNQGQEIDLSRIEIPVTVCWFPSGSEASRNPHGAARKLFVDVNKEARQPSEARLILLSDAELLNVFTRCLLNRLREDNPPLPLYAIEYDNPDDSFTQPVRWSAMANLGMLKRAIEHTVFCQLKYRQQMDHRFGGRPNEYEMNTRMRHELDLGSVFPSIIEEDNIELVAIGNKNFPQSGLDIIRSQFMKGWGTAILHLFGNLSPYKAHAFALQKLKEDWLTDDAISSLASDAIFVGVGMYWTLRESDEHWRKEVARLRIDRFSVPPKPDIVKAWESIESKNQDFQAYRANFYLGKATADSVKETNSAFEMMNTQACQLGACLMLSALADAANAKMEQVVDLAIKVTDALNAAFNKNVTQSRSRRLIFDRKQTNPLNRLPRLDPSQSIYFRYFWLELLSTAEAKEVLGTQISEIAQSFRDVARSAYLDFVVAEQAKALRRSNPTWNDSQLKEEAEEIEIKALRKAMKHWSLTDSDEFDQWSQTRTSNSTIQKIQVTEEVDEVDGSLEPELVAGEGSLDDVIESLESDD
ncbi:DNA sulfur modification protein DndB [Pseudanabaena sp. FACHB-2040]|uniref:DNA sulfur modification protein DndB n=1 Tax=Pseudanabaena sp. FACHB-2040 TaxID=2692859 RepID=UPI001689097C|nr:DNA sulfur modification protein DndB [Pseudanabaena sp. FACHB-2040]MBD2261075.1 hypothetical protein [Pseudanabaena sp. FACHB-2040]